MQLFKLFSLHNIIAYFTFFIILIFIFFLSYKYLYLEQSVYLLTNKLTKLEIEYNNPNVYSNQSNSNIMKTAEIIMNEIFTDDNICDNNVCNIKSTTTTTPITEINEIDNHKITSSNEVEIVNEIFDLKKDNEDKESVISGNTGGGHATKKALMKLTIDKLKAKCEERKLSTDGTKNQLADRIIVYDNTIEISDIIDE
jgi:hypothetical protein